jgi:hypothetical protein
VLPTEGKLMLITRTFHYLWNWSIIQSKVVNTINGKLIRELFPSTGNYAASERESYCVWKYSIWKNCRWSLNMSSSYPIGSKGFSQPKCFLQVSQTFPNPLWVSSQAKVAVPAKITIKVKQTNPSLHCKCKDISLNKTIFHLLLGWKQAARTHKHATAHPLKMHVTVHCILFRRLSMWSSFQSNKIASTWKEECLPLPQEPEVRELHMKPLAEKEKYNYKGLS